MQEGPWLSPIKSNPALHEQNIMFALSSPWRDQISPLPPSTWVDLSSVTASPLLGPLGKWDFQVRGGGHQEWAKDLLVPRLQSLGSRHISVHGRVCVYVGGGAWTIGQKWAHILPQKEERTEESWVLGVGGQLYKYCMLQSPLSNLFMCNHVHTAAPLTFDTVV